MKATHFGRSLLGCLLVGLAVTTAAQAESFELITSSYLGEPGFDDAVVGACIQSDGTVVLAANLGARAQQKLTGSPPDGDAEEQYGCIVRLDELGRRLVSITPVARRVSDLALDGNDHLYVAAGDDGAVKLSPDGKKTLWHAEPGSVARIDAGEDGHCAAIVDGKIVIYGPGGEELGTAGGGQFTSDVCVDSVSKTVIHTGFRNAHAYDGSRTYPVQIGYIRGHGYDGDKKWTSYDWSTDRDSDRFLNKPTNNMADTRGDRCAIGRDGKLYVTFQVAGGNHIFRYSPKDIMQRVEIVGGDKYHEFYNSRSEHKNFFGRYDPATGDLIAGQQFCGRLSSGRANSVVTKEGDITADDEGRVYVVGKAASGLPLSTNPTGEDYTGGGFILVMSPDLKDRLLCTRTQAGKGSPHAVAARKTNGPRRAVFAGGGMISGMFTKNALQANAGDGSGEKDAPKEGFFAVLEQQ